MSGNVTNKTVTTTITYKASTGKGTTRWTDDKGVDLKAKVSGIFKDTDGNDIPGYQLMAIETDEDDNVVNIYKKINTSTPTTGTKPTNTPTTTTSTPATGTPTTGTKPTTSAPTTGTPTTGTKPTTGTTPTIITPTTGTSTTGTKPTTSTPTTGTKPTTGNTSTAPRVNTITVYEYVDEAGKALKPKTATRLDKIPGYSIVKEENKTETKTSGNVTNKTITTRITYKKSTSTTTSKPGETIVTHVYKYVDEQGEPVALATSFRHDVISGYQKLREETSSETRTVNGETHELTVTTITYRAEQPTDVKLGTTPDKNTGTTQGSTTIGTTPGSTSGKQNTTGTTDGATGSTTQSSQSNDGSKGGVQTGSQQGTTKPTQQGTQSGSQQSTTQSTQQGTQQGTTQGATQGTKPQLPQTGDSGSFLTMIGSIISGLGFVGFKKRKK